MGGSGKGMALRFTTRRVGRWKRPVEMAHFYGLSSSKVFHARCERAVILSFIERVNGDFRRSRTGKTIYLEGNRAEDILRRLIVLAGCRQCIKNESKIADVADAVTGLSEFETIFWYSRMIEEYENRGYWGVCRVAKAFRVLYRID